MGWNDRIDPLEIERNEFLKELLESGRLDGAAKGIATLVLEKGEGCLSGKQHHVYEKFVIGRFADMKCKRCQGAIPLNEVLCAIEFNEGYCGYCANAVSRDD